MTRPLVSILLPARNEEVHLPAALKSIRRQSLQNWELIVVNDGSQDATAQILDQAAARDQRIRVHHQSASGLVSALNTGLQYCSAELVARFDADDIAHPRRLEKQVARLQQAPHLDLVACCVRHIPRPQLRSGMLAYETWQNGLLTPSDISRNIYVESPFAHPSVVYRKQLVMQLGGYFEQEWAEDYDLWLRMAQSGANFERLPDTLLYWRDRPQRLTRTAANCSQAAFRACKAHYLKKVFLAAESAVAIWGLGPEGKAWRKLLRQAGIEVAAWIDVDRKKIGQSIHDAKVHAPGELKAIPNKILVAVGARGARQRIRDWCTQHNLVEGDNFICVA